MKCIFCGYGQNKVIDSRDTDDGAQIRRRRQCLNCGKRFTTYEIVETTPILIIKRDNSRQPYNREKLKADLELCLTNLSISHFNIDLLVEKIEKDLRNNSSQEISYLELINIIGHNLRKFNELAYIRYSMIYGNIKSVDELRLFLNNINKQ